MDQDKYNISSLRQDIIDNNVQMKAVIQEISSFRGSIADLEILNEAGRSKLAALRKCIERLDDWVRDEVDSELINEVDTHRQQFSKILQAFRKANMSTMIEIHKADKEELFAMADESELRQRAPTRHNRTSLVAQQDKVTDKMLSISRHLSETTQKSAETLDTLITSSQSIDGTRGELQTTAGTISQSGKLLRKYGRRECTDKILLLFAFIFFLACVFYIVQKRLF